MLERCSKALVYLVVAAACAGPARAEDQRPSDLSANERKAIGLVILAPAKKIANEQGAQIPEMLDEQLKAKTDFRVVPHDERQMGCETQAFRFQCFVRLLWSDYDPASPALTREDEQLQRHLRPFDEVVEILRRANPRRERYLITLSSLRQSDSSDLVSALLIDTEEALRLMHSAHEAHRDLNEDDLAAVEGEIAEAAVKASPAPRTIVGDQLRGYLHDLVNGEFRREFEATGDWEPYGQIELLVSQAGLEVALDGQVLGTTRPGRTLIGTVLQGTRTVRLSLPGFVPAEAKVAVDRGRTSLLTLELQHEADDLVLTTRRVVFWSGVLAGAAGAAITGYGISKASSASTYRVVCIAPSAGASCGSPEFVRFGVKGGDEAVSGATTNPNPGLIGIAPLGYSLAGMGATWALGTALFGDDDSLPLWQLGAGAVVFVGSMLLSAHFDGCNGVRCPGAGSTASGLR